MSLTYAEAVVALQSRGRFGIRLGLARTQALLRGLDDPQAAFRGALIGGTNGKGSVLALAAAAIRAAGYRAGETPKPHLVSYRERLQVAGELVSPETLARLVERILPVADRVARRHGEPTEFELLTALTFAWFAEVGVDLALVEVGLGGRLDATHAWDGGVAAITNVALDHTDRLGPTIPLIAREKAAIIMRGDHAATGADGDALAVVRRRARRVGAPLAEVPPAPLLGWDRDGIVVDLPRLGETRVGLRGRHQAANVAVADAVLDALEATRIAVVPDEARRAGYASARWAGRLELLEHEGGDVLLDGAHNPAGATVLATALDDLRPHLAPGPVTLLTAVMADKDVEGLVRALGSSAALQGATVVCTRVSERSLPPEELAAAWASLVPMVRATVTEPVTEAALERALTASSAAGGPLVVAGSLYLVGEVRRRLVDDPRLRDPRPEAADGRGATATAAAGRGR
ncbi:MAG: bifunctional folylpolyglutamate synthase/dihydrofolate synthase [Candidatus Limnocylindrales bacterium]